MAAGELHTLLETEESQPLAERGPPRDRPWVALNMASSADGRAAIGGTSGGLGSEADQRQFAALRRETDCVLVGTGTLATERYGSIIRDAAFREERVARRAAAPADVRIVSRSGRVPLRHRAVPRLPSSSSRSYRRAGRARGRGSRRRRRPGLSPRFVDALRDLRARRDVRVCCSCATSSRDLRRTLDLSTLRPRVRGPQPDPRVRALGPRAPPRRQARGRGGDVLGRASTPPGRSGRSSSSPRRRAWRCTRA